ncbi:unnamed protein product, partial [Symbiodinium microadriaticum]
MAMRAGVGSSEPVEVSDFQLSFRASTCTVLDSGGLHELQRQRCKGVHEDAQLFATFNKTGKNHVSNFVPLLIQFNACKPRGLVLHRPSEYADRYPLGGVYCVSTSESCPAKMSCNSITGGLVTPPLRPPFPATNQMAGPPDADASSNCYFLAVYVASGSGGPDPQLLMMTMMNSLIELVNRQQSQSGSAGPSTPAQPPQLASSSSDETLKILQEENRQLQLRFDNMRAEQEKLQAQQRARNSAKRDRVRSLLQIIAEDEAEDEVEEDVQMVEPAEEEEQEEEWPDLSFAPAAKKAKKNQGALGSLDYTGQDESSACSHQKAGLVQTAEREQGLAEGPEKKNEGQGQGEEGQGQGQGGGGEGLVEPDR